MTPEKKTEVPDDAGEWDEEWAEEVEKPITLTECTHRLKRLNAYINKLDEINGSLMSWNTALRKMKEIINGEYDDTSNRHELLHEC